MSTTHDDNATTWRDLTDQLTPQQIAELEYCELHQIPPGLADPRQGQLNCARAMARQNLIDALCDDVPVPVDCHGTVGQWTDLDDEGFGRMYTIAMREVDGMTVETVGWQYDDGSCRDRSVMLRDEEVGPDEARRLAAALIAAADELDGLQ